MRVFIALLALAMCSTAAAKTRHRFVLHAASMSDSVALPEAPLPPALVIVNNWTTFADDPKAHRSKAEAADPFRTPIFRNAGPLLLP